MNGLAGAWLAGEAIVIWRLVHRDHRLPAAGELVGITGLFAALGLIAGYAPARGIVTALAYGLDIAALFNVLPAGLGGQIAAATAAENPDAEPSSTPQRSGNRVQGGAPAVAL